MKKKLKVIHFIVSSREQKKALQKVKKKKKV